MEQETTGKGFILKPFFNYIRKTGNGFKMLFKSKPSVEHSNYISRDLSWIKFNFRVLDQAKNSHRTIFERLKFLAITSSNLDEFFQIRIGSLYNYIDYGKERVDYSGLREIPFRKSLLEEVHELTNDQANLYKNSFVPEFAKNGFTIDKYSTLSPSEIETATEYFKRTIYPMLTPMVYDSYHSFPILMNKILVFGVITKHKDSSGDQRRLSFVQIPQNLPRFFEIKREDTIVFVPIEEIIRANMNKLFRSIEILSSTLFRITRNGDFTLEESDDMDVHFIDEVKKKLKTRRTGRVVRVEIEPGYSQWMMKILTERWDIDEYNIFVNDGFIDYTGLWQIVKHKEFKERIPVMHAPVTPFNAPEPDDNIFEFLKKKDLMLHHPYNSIQPLIDILERSAEDPNVLAIKITIYRLAKDSRITNALLKAAENGKHVSVLFEVKARFDEENNIKEAQRLQRAGCFVIYGLSNLKTHTKLCLIVRKEEDDTVTRYVHMSSGNYNEETSRLYTDVGLLSANDNYAHDVSEFFNVITGHSQPVYRNLITAPGDMRKSLIALIKVESENAKAGRPSGIAIKVNSLQDKEIIDAFYEASQAGVPIKLIIRGMSCLRPGRKGLSENIFVKSIVGNFLEHTRIYYFHNNGDPKVYGGSADMMVRSFERRIESLFMFLDPFMKQQAINIIDYNLKDNVNSYILHEDGTYEKQEPGGNPPFNIHEEFFRVSPEVIMNAKLF